MASNQVPNNIEDKTILKRFLTDLILNLNSNPYYSGSAVKQKEAIIDVLSSNSKSDSIDFLNFATKLQELQTSIKAYIEEDLETIILQNKEEVAIIAEQFGTFYDQALATSWYGLSVKAGGVVAGLEVGSLDPDVTTPGDESSYFRISADNFVVGRAYEDLSQEEKDYLAANNLPAFGTVYNASKQPVPAFAITWDSINQVYKHYFNGFVSFNNVDTGYKSTTGTTEIDGSMLRTGTVVADSINGNELNGLTINGGIINGARINGAVIKASYLDLDGELEVLTNYHISVATYNANPSLYTDAVYISADNEYRIPSMSVIYESNIGTAITASGSSLYGHIRSYDTANAGHNNKAVSIRPTFVISSDVLIIDMDQQGTSKCDGSIYFGNILLCRVRIDSVTTTVLSYSIITSDGTTPGTINDSNANSGIYVYSKTINIVSSGLSFSIAIGGANNQYGYSVGVKITLKQGTYTLTRDFTNVGYGFRILRSYADTSGGYDNFYTKLGSSISINNLI